MPSRQRSAGNGSTQARFGFPETSPGNTATVPRKLATMKRVFLILLVITVYVLHQDFWNWNKAEPLLFGFVPIGLAYHAAYSCLAAVLMWVFVKFAWPTHLEKVESHREDNHGKAGP